MDNKVGNIQFDINIDDNKLKILIFPGCYSKDEELVSLYHYHTEFEIHYILSGSFIFNIGGKEYTCKSKSLFILPPYKYHTIKALGTGEKICFQCRILKNDNTTFRFPKEEVTVAYEMPEAGLFIRILSDFHENDNEHNLLKLKAISEIIMLNINDTVLTDKQHIQKENAVVEIDLLERTLTHIYLHYSEAIRLSDLCAELFISERQISRILKAKTGHTFLQLLTQHRVNMAKKLIDENKMSFREIAETVGFTTYAGFWKAFTNYEGISPNLYKKSTVQ